MRKDEEKFEVTLTVRSLTHERHTTYKFNEYEIENGTLHEFVRFLTYRLQDFIQEKENAAFEREKSQNTQRLQ